MSPHVTRTECDSRSRKSEEKINKIAEDVAFIRGQHEARFQLNWKWIGVLIAIAGILVAFTKANKKNTPPPKKETIPWVQGQ